MANPYQAIAGVGPTIDNMREYLLTLYAQAYDAIDRHLIFGGVVERKATPQEIRAVEARFNTIISILERVGDKRTLRIVKKLKTLTIQHMRDKISGKTYARRLRELLREYGIKTPEIERIERKIDEIEARMRAQEKQPNVFSALDRALNNLASPQPRRGKGKRQPRRQPNVFVQLDRIMSRLTNQKRSGRGRR